MNPAEPNALPKPTDPLDPIHYLFAVEVASAFGDVLQNEASAWHQCMYHPETELPYPKEVIRTCLQYLAASPQTPADFVETTRGSTVFLETYVPVGPRLPRSQHDNAGFVHTRGWA